MLNEQHSTTITLPRGTLDLTYQTNSATNKSATNKNGAEQRDRYQLEDLLGFAQRINKTGVSVCLKSARSSYSRCAKHHARGIH
ncbi:adenine/guanine phosphoribosyltransferase [Psychrobacter sp. JCM 18901]|nr:hypothetical protein [Psychrobacter sp. JCM 18901]GAF56939.1 adenine/guanine phosphoribosyltransferase [Psychrobacter sp. JCM 18901]